MQSRKALEGLMMFNPYLPFCLEAAKECRGSRIKYLRMARRHPHGSEDRKIDLDIALLYKKHELQWLEQHAKDKAA